MKKKRQRMAMMTRRRMKKRKRRMNPRIRNQLWLNVVLPLDILTSDAMNHSCPAEKHHFDECAARVAHAAENPDENHHGHAEDCAEEFLHLMHCVDNKIAEPLFRQLR
jgi:hypothetical protein